MFNPSNNIFKLNTSMLFFIMIFFKFNILIYFKFIKKNSSLKVNWKKN